MDFREFFERVSSIPGGWALALDVFLIVLVALVIDFIQQVITRRLAKRAALTRNTWDDALFESITAPASALIWLIGISVAGELVGRRSEAEIFDYIAPLREIGIILILMWFMLRFIGSMETNFVRIREEEHQDFDRTAVDAIAKLARAVVVITSVLVLLQNLGLSISGLLAAGGIGGIAIGFAAKDLLANFFGGLTIYLDKPFKVGDWIRSPDQQIEGTVERIGWRTTRIRNFESRPLYVPNAIFTNIIVENPSRMAARRISETIGVRYRDFDKVRLIVDEVREMLKRHERIDQGMTLMVNFDSYGESSINFFIYCFAATRVWAEYNEIREDVMLKIGEIITRHGAEIARTTRTLELPDSVRIAMENGNDAEEGAQ
ncbi:MAG TPA: mechanosensitive ion channel family protein [Gammaproteobacteria bacterium]|nr:mechanosensitive ion channel family protein [Gammaproteobacteria bacterium]